MRQTKERRKTYLSARAVEMAGSGKYRDWEQIEFALCFDEGYLEARGWLDSRPRRDGTRGPMCFTGCEKLTFHTPAPARTIE